jgi:hypothetical protein
VREALSRDGAADCIVQRNNYVRFVGVVTGLEQAISVSICHEITPLSKLQMAQLEESIAINISKTNGVEYYDLGISCRITRGWDRWKQRFAFGFVLGTAVECHKAKTCAANFCGLIGSIYSFVIALQFEIK